MVSSFGRTLMVIICINLLLFVGGVRVIDDNDAFIGRFIDVSSYQDDNILVVDDELASTVNQPLARSGSGILQFIDSIGAVTSFISFLVNILFTPLGLFMGAGLPPVVGLMVGVPLITLLVIGIAYFIRSGV